jgi:hypothetical protein
MFLTASLSLSLSLSLSPSFPPSLSPTHTNTPTPIVARGGLLYREHLIREAALKHDIRSSWACCPSTHCPVSERLKEKGKRNKI